MRYDRHVPKSSIALLSILALFGMLCIAASISQDTLASTMVCLLPGAFFTLLFAVSLARMLSFTHIVVSCNEVIVFFKQGGREVFAIPGDLVRIDGDANAGEFSLQLNNGNRKWSLSVSGFENAENLLKELNDMVPLVRCYKDGRREKCSLLEYVPHRDFRMVVGTLESENS